MAEKRNTRPRAHDEGRKSPDIPGKNTPRILSPGECDVVRAIDVKIARVAARQCGVVTRRQLLRIGLRPSSIDERIASGKLHPVHRGVYLVGHSVPPFGAREMGAVLACGDGAVVSNRTAAEMFEWLEPDGGPVHISIPGRSRRQRDGIRLHRPTTLAEGDIGYFDHTIPITSPARTILDIAATCDFADTERAAQQALIQKVVTPAELRERINGQRGSAALKAILDAPRGRTESDGEDRLWALIVKAGMRRPERNAWVLGHKVDFLWRHEQLVVEADSVAYHSLRANVEADRRRDAKLRAHEFEVLRFTWTQITYEPEVVIAGIAAKLATATAARRP